ncbi:MAG: flagellar basal body-associated FliL family protein [Desulfamplus sp.]|nr:flagellar basal body-associated FliL family protein [Desulfamplus sp.]
MDRKLVLTQNLFVAISIILSIIIQIANCNYAIAKDEPAPEVELSPTAQLLLGSWSRYNNRVYTLLILRANGNWSSDYRIEGATSKIVERKGEASGTWKLDDKALTFTVVTSDMEEVWPTGTVALEIVSIDEKSITLRYPNARLITWTKARVEKDKKKEEGAASINPIITMKPIVVNLNKLSSKDNDRYLCLALELHLEEMEATAAIPKLHPRAWDSTIIFLSSLLYNDVKTFDEMKLVTDRLTRILNPYLDGLLADVTSTHIMVSSSIDKVDEFIIEHSPPPVLETPPDDENKDGDKDKKEENGKEEKGKKDKKKDDK